MVHLFVAGAGFILWAIMVILFYYSNWYSSITHIESASGFSGYLLFMGLLYIAYKAYTLFISPKKELRF